MENTPRTRSTYDSLSPEAVRRRKRFWTLWIIGNILLTFVIVPAVFLLVGDAIAQFFTDDTSTRVQASIGLYFLVAGGTFCTLLPVNMVAAFLHIAARASRQMTAERKQDAEAGFTVDGVARPGYDNPHYGDGGDHFGRRRSW